MTFVQVGRVLAYNILLLLCVSVVAQEYKIPEVQIQALKPKGFRASIEDAPNLGLFAFHGNINREIGVDDVGTISGEVIAASDGRWVVEDPNVTLKIGDVINYHVFAAVSSRGYVADNLSYTVRKLEDLNSPTSVTPSPTIMLNCKRSLTLVRGSNVCAGQTIFEDDFSEFRENLWQIEQYIPVHNPEYPFVSYQRLEDQQTVSVSNGSLKISPRLQQNLVGYSNDSLLSGVLNLFSGCTAAGEACVLQASGADILPPVVSGKVTSKNFAFTYGTVSVRAKLPQGDWLYPEILLEPFAKKYGSFHYASGLMKIATARGNKELLYGSTDYSNKVLYGGLIMDLQCRDSLLMKRQLTDDRQWGDDFHVYSLRWAPDRITLSVDGEEWARFEPSASGLAGRYPRDCHQLPRTLLSLGSLIAPFDDHFSISLGLAAGSVTEFPDGVVTGEGRPKPWSNLGRKALLNFWHDMDAWFPTWTQPDLLIDYIKVVAL